MLDEGLLVFIMIARSPPSDSLAIGNFLVKQLELLEADLLDVNGG